MRKLLPFIGNPHGSGRSALTCRYRCGDACFHEVPNTSDNEYVGDVIARAYSRRAMLRSAAVVTVATAAGSAVAFGGPGQTANATPSADAAAAARARAARPPVVCASRPSRRTPTTRSRSPRATSRTW